MAAVNEARARGRERTKTEAEQSIAYEVLRNMQNRDLDVIAAAIVVSRDYDLALSLVLTFYDRHFLWASHHWTVRHPS